MRKTNSAGYIYADQNASLCSAHQNMHIANDQKNACSTQLLSTFSALPLSVVRVLRTESGVRLRFSFPRIVFRKPLHQEACSSAQPPLLEESGLFGEEGFDGEVEGEKVTRLELLGPSVPVDGSCQLPSPASPV